MMKTYQNALDFLFNRTNFEREHASSFHHRDFKLDRMRALLEELGNPQTTPAVHIAGTKGKGSTAHMVAACLQASGLRTGLFTSPHLELYEERIRINGIPIDREEIVQLAGLLKSATRKLQNRDASLNPTFFELTTALAWLAFQSHDIQIAVMEVGLGGRLDSTNLCHPLVTAVTSIGLDHTQQLGSTIKEITIEKAGIFKTGIPVISGCVREESRKVIRQKSQQHHSRLWEVDRDIKIAESKNDKGEQVIHVTSPERTHADLQLSLLGAHQIRNLAVALGILDCLHEAGMRINFPAIPSTLKNLSIPGRQEILSHHPLILLDVAHNEDSNHALISTIEMLPSEHGPRVLIFGSSRDKNFAAQLSSLSPHFDHIFLTACSNSERSCLPEKLLSSISASNHASIVTTPDVSEALHDASSLIGDTGTLVVSGSFYLAGECRSAYTNMQQKKQPHRNVVA